MGGKDLKYENQNKFGQFLNPKYVQLVGDAVIPLLGFFLWNWNLYFILVFYFIDMLTKEVLLHVKSNKINHFTDNPLNPKRRNDRLVWIKYGMLSGIVFTFILILVHFSMPAILPKFNAITEIQNFWFYKEMGIEQGYVLVPLIVLMAFTQYKVEFLLPAQYTKMTIQNLWKSHIQAMLVILAFTGLTFGLVTFTTIPEWILVIGIVTFSSIYQLLQKNTN